MSYSTPLTKERLAELLCDLVGDKMQDGEWDTSDEIYNDLADFLTEHQNQPEKP